MNMRAAAARLAGIIAALLVYGWLYADALTAAGLCWAAFLMLVFYLLLRPLLLILALPLNLLLFGLVTPLADALLIRLAAAIVGGMTAGYGQSLLLALAISLAYLPYSRSKQKRLWQAANNA